MCRVKEVTIFNNSLWSQRVEIFNNSHGGRELKSSNVLLSVKANSQDLLYSLEVESATHGGIIIWSGKGGVTRVKTGGGRTLCTLHRGKGKDYTARFATGAIHYTV